jgi:hypothetical protein
MAAVSLVKLKLELQEFAAILDEANKPVNIADRVAVCDETLIELQKLVEENLGASPTQRFERAFHYEDFFRLNRMMQHSRNFEHNALKRYMSAYFVKFERDGKLRAQVKPFGTVNSGAIR